MDNITYKKKENSIDKLKFFTDLLFNKNYDYEQLSKYENLPDFSNFKFRIINLLANHPKLLWYINRHFNNYESYSVNNAIWYDSLRTLIQTYGISNRNSFKYTKFRYPERKSFKTAVSDYYPHLNNNDLNELYRLYCIKIVSIDDIKTNDKVSKVNAIEAKIEKKEEISKHNFNKNIQKILESKSSCMKCKYFNTEKLFIDGNTNNLNNMHVLFINDFSTISDFEQNKIFFEKQHLNKLENVNYLIMNVLPCNIRNDITNFKKISENCKHLMESIITNIKCDLKILIGPRVREWFGYKKKINPKYLNNFSGDYFLLYSEDEDEEKFNEGFDKVISIVKSKFDRLTTYKNENSKDDTTLTLFDIKVVKNNVLYIFQDSEGNKKFVTEPIQFPVYIKNGKFDNCDYIEHEMDEVAYLTYEEKMRLSSNISKNLNQQIKLSN
jgi:hypothetical protein